MCLGEASRRSLTYNSHQRHVMLSLMRIEPSAQRLTLTLYLVLFFQAEDGIRDLTVTGVQTCALPICATAKDQNGNTMSGVTFTWTATGGTIDSTGKYSAGSTAGTFSVKATSGSVSGSATEIGRGSCREKG